jgi:hypothetical protein
LAEVENYDPIPLDQVLPRLTELERTPSKSALLGLW